MHNIKGFTKRTDLVKMDNGIKEGNYRIRICYNYKTIETAERREREKAIEHIIYTQISLSKIQKKICTVHVHRDVTVIVI